MTLFWRIRYLDRSDREFRDRMLYLDTESLDPVTRAAIALVAEGEPGREILKYRHLFTEGDSELILRQAGHRSIKSVRPAGQYFEDETGKELTAREMGPIRTGNPNTLVIPPGAKQHDIELMLAAPRPLPLGDVSLTTDEIRTLGYFCRDLKELVDSAFMKDGSGTLNSTGSADPFLETAITDDEVRSFVTIFRRLYMRDEPASFQNAVAVAVKALGDHPYAKWLAGAATEVQDSLDEAPEFCSLFQLGACSFTSKRLIDVYLYTQYAHQPCDRRERQFLECLAEVNGKRALLTWLFLAELEAYSSKYEHAGRVICSWFQGYCEHHGITPNVLLSLRDDHPGLGTAEKAEDRRARLFREKTEELALELWNARNRPEGGPAQFMSEARSRLSQRLEGE